jgi:hypothetical protein
LRLQQVQGLWAGRCDRRRLGQRRFDNRGHVI